MVDIQIPDDLGDMSSILHGMVDLKDQFRRMTQLDLTSDLIADKTFRTVHGIQSLLLLFLFVFRTAGAQHRKIYCRIASIAGSLQLL